MKFSLSSPRRAVLWPVVLAGTITLCSGFPAALPTVEWVAPDKLGHFAAYGALATGCVRVKGLARWPWLGAWWAILLTSGYGLGDEFRQAWGGVRMFELADWLADTAGAIVAVTLYLRWKAYRQWMERSLRLPWCSSIRSTTIKSAAIPGKSLQ